MIKQLRNLMFVSLVVLAGCSSTQPLEDYNRAMYNTNRAIDKYTLKPITKAYQAITPDVIERRVNSFFDNLGEIGTMVNSLLQGKFHNAAVSSSRLVWNTTLGLGGLFDVATFMGLEAQEEDFGQTLQVWGLPAGPYVVLPLLGPSTITDTVGLLGDWSIDPVNLYDDWSDHSVHEGLIGLRLIDQRAELIQAEALLETGTTDEYLFVKSAYLQRRAALVRDGEVNNDLDDAVDALFDESGDGTFDDEDIEKAIDDVEAL